MSERAYAALRELLDLAGLPAEAAARTTLSGDDPVLPTRYRIGTAGLAAQGAIGIAAAELWRLRTGRSQAVGADMLPAVMALRGTRYMTIDGKPLPREFAKLMGFYRAREGRWVFLHTGFPNVRDAGLRVLGVPAEEQAVRAACAEWDGEALETAMHEGGGCLSFVRTHAEWARHPHAIAIAQLPVVEITRIGDAPPQPLPAGDRPLSGIRALDLTRVIAGPVCGRTLAEHGADVLKITAGHLPDSGLHDLETGIGKLSARLDLRDAAQAATLRELVRGADVFTDSFRPGTMTRRGFGPEHLAELRPGIVYVKLNAWGHVGPWQGRRGYDTIVQSATGIADGGGDAEAPRLTPAAAIDYVTGNLMAFGAMVALARRATEGGSWLVRASLATTGRWIVDRGVEEREDYIGMPNDAPEETVGRLSTEMDGPSGRMRYLAPVLRMSETQPHWTRPPVPLGHHAAAWPE